MNAQLTAYSDQLTTALPVSFPDLLDHPDRALTRLIGVLPLYRHDS